MLKGTLTLGADASVAAGPFGRDAETCTSAVMRAEMLSYSRAQGLFAGVTLGPDSGANENINGKKFSAANIIDVKVPTPA